MHNNYTKIKGLDSEKITSLPNRENVINLHASFQSSPKKNLHAHHKTHLHTMKVVTHSYPQFPRSLLGTPGLPLNGRPGVPNFGAHTQRKERNTCIFSLALLKQA